MAKDRLFFFFSFAILGLIAAFLFRSPEQKSPPKENQGETPQAQTEKAIVEVLVAKEALKTHDHLSGNNYEWKKITVSEFNNDLILKTPEIEKTLPNALAAKEIGKDAKITRSDLFWPIEEPKNLEASILKIQPGKRAIPFQITKRFGLVQFLKPGVFIDLTFNATAESGFGAVSLTLLKNIRVLAIEDDQDSGNTKLGTRNRSDAPLEVLLEMSPQEADIYSYALSSGDVSLSFLSKPEQDQDTLGEKLFLSNSLDDFRSILVTHTIRSFFPHEELFVTVVPKGYVLTGKISNSQKMNQILDLLAKFSPDGNQSIVNLVETNEPPPGVPEKEEIPEAAFLNPERGMVPVLLEEPTAAALLPYLEPGMQIDIAFQSRPDLGFGSVNVILFEHIRILGIQDEKKKIHVSHGKEQESRPLLSRFFLEMTPRDAEIFHYAQSIGILFLSPIDENSNRPINPIADSLLKSRSSDEFRSRLITGMVRDLFPLVDVNIVSTSKGFVVEGHVSDQQKADKIMEIIQKLAPADEKSIVNLLEVEPQQVLINVKVMEMDSNVKENLGLNWQVLFNHNATSAAFAAVTAPIAPFTPNFFVNGSEIHAGNFTLSAFINMLEEDSSTKVLAEPNLTTISGKTAHFFAGGEFPILIPQGGTLIGTVTVEYKKYGVLLDFTPFVDINGLITMQIIPEISTIDRANSVILSGFVLPGLISRRVETTVKLWPGQSYVIAGLLQNEIRNVDDNLYGLNRLPIIGPLFSSKRYENQETELVVVVTPYLIRSERHHIPQENRCIPAPCKRCGKLHPLEHLNPIQAVCEICGMIGDLTGHVCH